MDPNKLFTFQVVQAENNHCLATVTIDPNHAVFEGHFPQQPIVPGVCMIEMVQALVKAMHPMVGNLHQSNPVKFLQPWIPAQHLQGNLEIKWTVQATQIYVQANLNLGESKCMHGQFVFLST